MSEIIDLNQIQHYESLELLAKQVVEGFITGLHKSPFHGFSVEFAEHRQYNAGESTKHIDWKLYGRTDKLYIKKYEEETNLRCQIIIDNSSSMYFPVQDVSGVSKINKIKFSVYAAAAIIQMLKTQRDAFGLNIFSDKIELQTQTKSNSIHHKFLIAELEKLLHPFKTETKKGTFATQSLHLLAEQFHKRSLVVIFSDMFESESNTDELFAALQHMRHNKHEVILFHTVDKKQELDFHYENRPYRFIDVETGQELKLNPKDVKEEYVKTVQEFKKELEQRCGYYHIDFIEADINKGFDQILLPYLVKRKRLY